MDDPQIWTMPALPPADVISVRDADGVELHRHSNDGEFWVNYGTGAVVQWDYLIYAYGPITAEPKR